jgi:hypothetical protein
MPLADAKIRASKRAEKPYKLTDFQVGFIWKSARLAQSCGATAIALQVKKTSLP